MVCTGLVAGTHPLGKAFEETISLNDHHARFRLEGEHEGVPSTRGLHATVLDT